MRAETWGGTPASAVLPEDVRSALVDVLDRSVPSARGAELAVRDSWTSPTALLWRVDRSDHSYVVKRLAKRPGHAQRAHEALLRLSEVMAGVADPPVHVVRSFGSSLEPPIVVTEYVPGVDLDRVLSDGSVPDARVEQLVAACGEGLGLYHGQSVQPRAEGDRKVPGWFGSLLLRRTMVRDAMRRAPLVVSAGDFSPQNLRVPRKGHALYWLDPPVRQTLCPPHRDVAQFLRGLYGGLGSAPAARPLPRKRRRLVEQAFLEGYARRAPQPMIEDVDRQLIATYRAGLTQQRAKRHWAQGRRIVAARLLILAAREGVYAALGRTALLSGHLSR